MPTIVSEGSQKCLQNTTLITACMCVFVHYIIAIIFILKEEKNNNMRPVFLDPIAKTTYALNNRNGCYMGAGFSLNMLLSCPSASVPFLPTSYSKTEASLPFSIAA